MKIILALLLTTVSAFGASAMADRPANGIFYSCGALKFPGGPEPINSTKYSVTLEDDGGTLREVSHLHPARSTPLKLKQRGMESQTYLAGDIEVTVTNAPFVGTPKAPSVRIHKVSNPSWTATCSLASF